MRRLSFFFILCLALCHCAIANEINFDKIALTPYIESDNVQDGVANNLLINKLNQIVLKCGMASQSLDDRFIIAAHASEIERVPTSTTPVKYALKIMLTIYVGDGIENSLFSSHSIELKGIGNSVDEAYLSAYRKLSVNDPKLLQSVESGRKRIIDYYNEHSSNIISHAKALAGRGDYDQAIYNLFIIPPMCHNYEEAQMLAEAFATEAANKYNESIITNARAAWAASPNEVGAREAQNILAQISNPSKEIIAKSQALSIEMASRIQQVEDQRLQLEREKEQHRHAESTKLISAAADVEKTRINAARDIAVSYNRNRPRVVHHVHWW